jgi:DNA-binding FadR family transcriptional regulator
VSHSITKSPRPLGVFAKQNLHGQIAEYLGTKIVSGELVAGEILPTEASLGVSLGVSRTAIREAIKVLSSKGLVEVRRKTGSRVRSQRDWNALDPDVISWQFAGDGIPTGAINDLTELRRIIEPACARLAAKRATAEELAEIEKALIEMEQAAGKTEASVEADLNFHLAILEATHNSFMRPFGALIQAALRASFRLTNADMAAYRLSLTKHRAVLASIRNGKPEEADIAMQTVLRGSQRDLEHALRPPTPSRASGQEKKKSNRRKSS